MQPKRKGGYILGLDLGANSIGWALLRATVLGKDGRLKPFSIESTGARIFEAGVEGDIESGKDESRSKARRDARSVRRRLDRTSRRLSHLFYLLQDAGLLPESKEYQTGIKKKTSGDRKEDMVKKAQARYRIITELDKELLNKFAKNEPLALQSLPYILRAKALDEKLEPFELGRALYHLGQRRGFLSNRKADLKDDEEIGKVKSGILELDGKMEEVNARTLGEYFSKLNPKEERIRSRWTSRGMYDREFNLIWESHAKYNPEILTEELRKKIWRAIFYQRPVKSQSHLIGKCQFEKIRKRAPIACLDFQRFRMVQKVNNTEFYSPKGEALEFTSEQRDLLLDSLEKKGDITFAKAKKLLGLKKEHRFNWESGGEKEFIGNRTAEKIIKIFGYDRWQKFSENERNQIVDDILSIQHESGLLKRGRVKWGLDENNAKEFSNIKLEKGYCGLSRQSISKLLPLMEKGTKYMTAVKEVYGEIYSNKKVDFLPPVVYSMPELTNPTVKRVLTELKKVVNGIIGEYGKPDEIRIELARELKKTRKDRKRITQNMRKNEKARLEAAEKIIKEAGIKQPTRTDITKCLLWEESNGQCPYTGKEINIKKLFGAEIDIEHIIPESRCLDNSYMNKTLCFAKENREIKHNKTPWEAYGSDPKKWEQIIQRVKRFQREAARIKLERFQIKDLKELDDFISSQLNDTKYASKLAKKYLGLLYGEEALSRIQATKGGMTAVIRGAWKLNSILKDGDEVDYELDDVVSLEVGKNRTDHRHHAVDAVCIALTNRSTVKMMSDASKRAFEAKRRRFAPVAPPWNGFYDNVKDMIDKTVVSHRVSKKVSGPLHAETIYSYQGKDERGKPIVHIRKPLSAPLTKNEVENIVDDKVREIVLLKLKELGGDLKKLGMLENHPYMETKDGRKIPIHKVRIRKTLSTEEIGTSVSTRHVEISSNHHIEIYEYKDKKGKIKWDGDVVSTFEAMRRLRKGDPIIKRDQGEGNKFLFSLAINESVSMKNDEGNDDLYIVQKIGQNKQIFFYRHNDARPKADIQKKSPCSRYPESLRKSGAKKILITPLGDIRWAND
jgi:CRISPR-associated endonuclease Csn1